MRVKICGITRVGDALHAEKAGADAVGVILFSDSPRCVNPGRAREIFGSVGPFITTVAVTHTRSRRDLNRIVALRPCAIQISHPFNFPESPPARVLRVVKPGDPLPEECDAIVVDGSGGTGSPFDLPFAREVVQRSRVPVILAGGLALDNVAGAIRDVRPYAVDVASGVELRPGVKDPSMVAEFIRVSREALP